MAEKQKTCQVYDQNFYGVVDGEGGKSESCLKWGWGIIKESFQNHLRIGNGYMQKLFVGGRSTEGVIIPGPRNILIVHQNFSIQLNICDLEDSTL